MALSPMALFVAHPRWPLDDDAVGLMNLLVTAHNLLILEGSFRCVYSSQRIEDGDAIKLRMAVQHVLLSEAAGGAPAPHDS
jgi:hypothetical protein